MPSSMILAVFVFALSTTRNVFCWARLEAVVLLPHGSEALEPSVLPDQTPERAAAEEIAAAAARAGHWLSEIVNPDLIFLSTPHGITLQRNFGIYIGKYASGSVTLSPEEEASEQENWHNNNNNNNNSNTSTRTIIRHLDPVKIAENRSIHIVRELGDEKHWNVEGIQTSPFDSNDVPLQYGSIIPLLMLQQSPPPRSQSANTTPIARAVATTTRSRLLRGHAKQRLERLHVFFSHPNRRHVEDTTDSMMSELLQLGHWFRTWMDNQQADLRIAVIISGDLSHTHDWRNGPYGYSPAAVPMDAALGRWASSPFRHAHDLLVEARSLQPQAMSCGFTGYVLLHGMLTGATTTTTTNYTPAAVTKNSTTTATTATTQEEEEEAERDDFDAKVLVNRNATYFGMMVATFRRR